MKSLKLLMGHGGLIPYIFIGGIALLVELGSFFALAKFDSPVVFGNFAAMTLGMFTSFGLNCRYNFKVNDRLMARFASFAAVTALSYILSTLLLVALIDGVGFAAFAAKVVTLPVVLAVQFTLNRRLTFASRATAEAEEN
jgi:putative flippase GtrA